MARSPRAVEGGVTAARGMKAAAIRAGLKEEGPDLALVASERGAACAGCFTTNLVKAAPVRLCQERVGKGPVSAIFVNSGIANACTGEEGYRAALELTARVGEALGVVPEEVLVASTGLIGKELPLELIARAIPRLVERLSPEGGPDAARAIMTTDTAPKEAALEFEAPGGMVRVGGMAKGAGMIRPRMATMLAFLATDAWVEGALLKRLLSRAVEDSFNCITVDGETSTNDSVICLANGVSGITLNEADAGPLGEALEQVCSTLARSIVRDGEGATKFVEVRVRGAASSQEAKQAAMAIANSLLVKTALFGEDPNWGRILAAAGASGVRLDPEGLTLELGGVRMVQGGRAASGNWEEPARKALKEKSISLCLDIGLGQGESRVWTTDLSTDYVNFNARYRT